MILASCTPNPADVVVYGGESALLAELVVFDVASLSVQKISALTARRFVQVIK